MRKYHCEVCNLEKTRQLYIDWIQEVKVKDCYKRTIYKTGSQWEAAV